MKNLKIVAISFWLLLPLTLSSRGTISAYAQADKETPVQFYKKERSLLTHLSPR